MVRGGVLGGVTKVKDVCDDDSEAPPGIELLRAGENDCLVPTPIATGEPVLGEPLRGEPVINDIACTWSRTYTTIISVERYCCNAICSDPTTSEVKGLR